MTAEQIAEIRARAEKATPGPWKLCLHLEQAEKCECTCGYRGGIWGGDEETRICEMGGTRIDGIEVEREAPRAVQFADARLIATSRTDIPALCDSHDEQAKRIAELERENASLRWSVAEGKHEQKRAEGLFNTNCNLTAQLAQRDKALAEARKALSDAKVGFDDVRLGYANIRDFRRMVNGRYGNLTREELEGAISGMDTMLDVVKSALAALAQVQG